MATDLLDLNARIVLKGKLMTAKGLTFRLENLTTHHLEPVVIYAKNMELLAFLYCVSIITIIHLLTEAGYVTNVTDHSAV
jgi:hypothetical protein